PGPDGGQQQQCGVIVGSKRTTVYAVDPSSGSVRWVQDPDGGGAGGGTRPTPAGEGRRGQVGAAAAGGLHRGTPRHRVRPGGLDGQAGEVLGARLRPGGRRRRGRRRRR
ncbi:hypothetical protein THAOC_27553, partial [Thalassiosira oceanica]